jgi:hypothetical protein
VDKVLIYRYFGDMGGLLRRFGQSADFWPSLDEVLGPQREVLREANAGRVARRILINYTRAIRRRPTTLQLLAWECCHRNELTRALEETREPCREWTFMAERGAARGDRQRSRMCSFGYAVLVYTALGRIDRAGLTWFLARSSACAGTRRELHENRFSRASGAVAARSEVSWRWRRLTQSWRSAGSAR